MERGLLVIVNFVEMTCDRVRSFHPYVIKMFFPSFNKRSSRFANILFLALCASQYIYHVVHAAIDVFWTWNPGPIQTEKDWKLCRNKFATPNCTWCRELKSTNSITCITTGCTFPRIHFTEKYIPRFKLWNHAICTLNENSLVWSVISSRLMCQSHQGNSPRKTHNSGL